MILKISNHSCKYAFSQSKLPKNMMLFMAIIALSCQAQPKDMEYDFDALQGSFGATITFPTDANQTAQLIKLSPLSPAMLALIADNNAEPSSSNFKIIDSQGRIMPMSLRMPKKIETTDLPISVVSVQTDNPMAVEKLRQALRIEYEQTANQINQTDSASSVSSTTNPSIHVNLSSIPSNHQQIEPDAMTTWWLANPLTVNNDASNSQNQLTLQLQFGKSNPQRPLQVQIYGSDDLQNWQLLNQSVISPFDKVQDKAKSSQANDYSLTLSDEQANLRYWQVVTNQPVTLNQANAKQRIAKPTTLLTQATFIPVKHQPTHWQLNLPQPVLINGIDFSVPENQLWQINLTTANQNSRDVKNKATTLVNAQIDHAHRYLNWQGSVIKSLDLTGQMSQTQIPVKLATPVYEIYFLAQGKAPYQLIINQLKANAEPSVMLSDSQIKHFEHTTSVQAGQLENLQKLADTDAERNKLKNWGLWGVLILILIALASLAYRLYQQITIKSTE